MSERPLIPRRLILGNPERASGRISPDGRWLGYVAPRDGVMNVQVAPADRKDEARFVTADTHRGIREFAFARTGHHLLYMQDEGGDENDRLFILDLDAPDPAATARALTPAGAKAQLVAHARRRPHEVVLLLNDRAPTHFDVVIVDIVTGAQRRVLENDQFVSFLLDGDHQIRFGLTVREDGGTTVFRRTGDDWEEWISFPQQDALTSGLLHLTDDGTTAYLVDSRDRDTSALFAVDLGTGERKLVHHDPRADIADILADPVTREIRAVAVDYAHTEWTALDPSTAADLTRLNEALGEGAFSVLSRTEDDARWVLLSNPPDVPARYYLYDRASGALTLWFEARPELAPHALPRMHPAVIDSRDGLPLVSYLTLPLAADPSGSGVPTSPLPMVLLVHGGPWHRDHYAPNPWHILLADRGYAVLSVNFRGSTGFGKAFLNAGNFEWGRKMHDDLMDAVAWATDRGIARRDAVAIMGGSYGGYATLIGLTKTPESFACGVDIVGPSSLLTMLDSIPPYWIPLRRTFTTRVGDDQTEEGRALLLERSPLTHVDAIRRPLLIAQGANDPRVKQAESDQIVAAMTAHGIGVTYALYPDEGHGFARPENNLSFAALTEAFLARHLGGRAEPIGDALRGSSLTVPAGAADIEGLPEALQRSAAGA